jgi:hypothetical protein
MVRFWREGALRQSELVPLADLPSCFVLIALVWLLSGVAAAWPWWDSTANNPR